MARDSFTSLPSELRNRIYDFVLRPDHGEGGILDAYTNMACRAIRISISATANSEKKSHRLEDDDGYESERDHDSEDGVLIEELSPSEDHDSHAYEDQCDFENERDLEDDRRFLCGLVRDFEPSNQWARQPSLTRVSRQIRTEALPIYYGANHFVVTPWTKLHSITSGNKEHIWWSIDFQGVEK